MIESSKNTQESEMRIRTEFNFVNNCMLKSEIMMSLLTRNLSLPVMYAKKDNF